jgi:hypothetical protein
VIDEFDNVLDRCAAVEDSPDLLPTRVGLFPEAAFHDGNRGTTPLDLDELVDRAK